MENNLISNLENDGAVLQLTLAHPPGNILDTAVIGEIRNALSDHRDTESLYAVIVTAKGPNFSYGASVEEHLPAKVVTMMQAMHGLLLDIITYPLPVFCVVQGKCLGGGLELACACSQIFAAPDTELGQPEIKLAVIAPFASVLLPERIGQQQAEDMLLTGRSIDADTAENLGLVNAISEDPLEAAREYIRYNLMTQSRFALRQAVRASRVSMVNRCKENLELVSKQYLDELMNGKDPVEGLTAFLENRQANWKHE